MEESRFLDLFSGSGGIGIEALSRGASQAVFVEQNRKAAACIEENLNHTHLREKAVVMSKDVMTALRILEDKKQAFDYIFMDPPYGKLLEKEAVLYLDGSVLCDENTTIIIESDLDTEFSWIMDTGFTITKDTISTFGISFVTSLISSTLSSIEKSGFFALLINTPIITLSKTAAVRFIISKCPRVIGSKLPG